MARARHWVRVARGLRTAIWTITLRDLQYRGRQFGIAVAGAALVFAITLVLTGVSSGFRTEARDIVRSFGADAWVVPAGVSGPFTSHSAIPAAEAERVGRIKGVHEAYPVALVTLTARRPDGEVKDINVIGHDIGALGDPAWGRGRAHAPGNETVVDKRLGVHRGDTIRIAGHRLRVTRVVSHRSYFAGVPAVYVSLREAQRLSFDRRHLATSIVVRGTPRRAPRGYQVMSAGPVRADLIRPLHGATVAIDTLRVLMWIVAVVIIGAVTYMSALERVRDFAVLKAVGSSSRSLAASLAAQSIIASAAAAVLGAGIAQLLKPLFPVPVTITSDAYVALPVIAIVIGVLSSLTALRRAVGVDPALAFAG